MRKISFTLLVILALMLLSACIDRSDSLQDGAQTGGVSTDDENKNTKDDPAGPFDGIDDVIDYGDNNMNDTEHNDLINSDGTFTMIASVTNVSEYLEVDVIRAPYGNTGPFWVIISSETKFADSDGNPISKSDIKTGDTVKITYGGQVMMSYPPKIVAYSVTVEK